MFTLTTEEMLYYSSEYFIAHNLISKESTVIKREGCLNHTVLYIDQFQNEQKNIVIVTIERFNHCLYVYLEECRSADCKFWDPSLRHRRKKKAQTINGPSAN